MTVQRLSRSAVANLRAARSSRSSCAATAAQALPLERRGVRQALPRLVRRQVDVGAGRRCSPALGLAGLAGIRSERAAHTCLPASRRCTSSTGALGMITARPRHRPQAGGVRRAAVQPRHGAAAAGARVAGDGRRDRAGGGGPAPRAVVAMARDFRRADHLPKLPRGRDPAAARAAAAPAPRDHAADARPLPRLRRARQGRATGTRSRGGSCSARRGGARRSGSSRGARRRTLGAFCDLVTAQDREPRIPVLEHGRREAVRRAGSTGSAMTTCPRTARPGGRVAAGLDAAVGSTARRRFRSAPTRRPARVVAGVRGRRAARAGVGRAAAARKAWGVVMRGVLSAFYSHPWAWNEIGFGGPAYPRGYTRLGVGQREIVGGRAGLERRSGARGRSSAVSGSCRHGCARSLAGALRPPENDSAFLLDLHRRAVPTRADGALRRRVRGRPRDRRRRRGRRHAGPAPGAARLEDRRARAGPFWDPDRDWVSDEAGSHRLYWNEPRVIGGEDPVELGKNNSGHGVGGSMVHYAGYCPRFHPSDFEVAQPRRRRRGLADLLRRSQAALRAGRARAAGRRASTGRGATRTATRTRRIRSPAAPSSPARARAG